MIISDENGCDVTYNMDPITIANSGLTADINVSMAGGNTGEQFIFSSTTAGGSGPVVQWDWDFSESTVSNNNGANVPYTWHIPGMQLVILEVTDENGCIGIDSLYIPVSDLINVPNVFTPNGDGINDLMTLDYDVFDGGYDLVILNRWGNIVHEVIGQKGLVLWDGTTMAGRECNDGVYFYKIKGNMFGVDTVKHGHVSLLRGL